MVEASWYEKRDNGSVQCLLCPHHCVIKMHRSGLCLTRVNKNGALYASNYCAPVSIAIDPVEKKPLYHFYPGKVIYSTGPNGCTFKCDFCQNAEISQNVLSVRSLSCESMLNEILKSGAIGVAYTYSEPYIWFETIMDLGLRVKEQGLKNVMVTNGYMEPEPLQELVTVVDAMNIDIKSMNNNFYKKICKGELAPVLRTCEYVKKHCHLEITNLLISDTNDQEEDVAELARWIKEHLGKDTPLHLSRYFPRYKMTNKSTDEHTVLRAWEVARQYLDFVYVGNMFAGDKADTLCPNCNTLLIERSGYKIEVEDALKRGTDGKMSVCSQCNTPIPVVR